jgi:hypothetical protein
MNDLREFDEEVYNKFFPIENNNELYKKYFFCSKCRIIFDRGCIHACNNKTNRILIESEMETLNTDCHNGHLIGKWKYNNEIYIGMPQFDTIEEWYNELKNIEVLEWICPNNGIHCTKGFYSKDNYPKYYSQCSLRT